jgi:hypothetical protein
MTTTIKTTTTAITVAVATTTINKNKQIFIRLDKMQHQQ